MPACPSDNSGIKIKMNTDRWWNDTDRGIRSTGKETCQSATVSTTNLTRTDMGLETRFQVGNPCTNTA